MPDDLLAEMDGRRRMPASRQRKATRLVRDLTRQVLQAREAYERRHGVVIEPEPGIRPTS